MTKHKIWYVPVMDSCGYAFAKFFKTEQEAKAFVDYHEDSCNNEELQPIGRQPGTSLEFEITDLGEVVLPPREKQ